ncbi:MAG: hypothetical protein ACYSRR_03655 [Planctomycetota bacterium]|jgi:hypothetical protein
MTGAQSNHCRIVQETISGEREISEKTLASLAVLNERLERVKKLGAGFGNIRFSHDAGRLAKQNSAVAVC